MDECTHETDFFGLALSMDECTHETDFFAKKKKILLFILWKLDLEMLEENQTWTPLWNKLAKYGVAQLGEQV